MHIRLPLILATALLLAACGNKADLLHPSQVPPEDRGRFLIKSSIPTQAERDAAEDADWDDDAGDDADSDTDVDADSIDDARDDAGDAAGDGGALPPVPVILDVPQGSGTP